MISSKVSELMGDMEFLFRFFYDSSYARRKGSPDECDFVAGNPQELAMPEYVEALRKSLEPKNKDWFAYMDSDPHACAVVAAGLKQRFGKDFTGPDVLMTNAAISALAVVFHALLDSGDEAIIISPPHFLYSPIIKLAGGVPVTVRLSGPEWDLDVEAIRKSITPKTRAVLINTPHNPTGRVYPKESLDQLSAVLAEASERNGRPVYLVSDEAYNRLIFDDREFTSPISLYPNTLLVYSFGKVLLAPGQRMGYIAIAPDMPGKEMVASALAATQVFLGWAFPNALLQRAIDDLNPMSIDVKQIQRRRDRMVEALKSFGYDVYSPESTFYLIPKSPIEDDLAFTDKLARSEVYVMPGDFLQLPGHFRISLSASDEMVERALPVFEKANET